MQTSVQFATVEELSHFTAHVMLAAHRRHIKITPRYTVIVLVLRIAQVKEILKHEMALVVLTIAKLDGFFLR